MQVNATTFRRLIAAVCALAVLLLAFAVANRAGDVRTVTAEFPKTPGLYVGNDVVVLGVPVGKVTKIEPRGTRVNVTMELDRATRLPADVHAVLLPRSVVTDRVIEMTPTYRDGPELADGGQIPLERTTIPVEFHEIVESVNHLSAELGRMEKGSGAIDDFMTTAAANAKGNGARLSNTLNALQGMLAGLSTERGDTAEFVRKLAKLTHLMAENDRTIRSFSTNVTEATTMLAGEGKNINAALNELLGALRDIAGFATEHREELRKGIDGLGRSGATFGARSTELAEIVDALPLLMQNVARAVDPATHRLRVRGNVDESVLGGGMLAGLCDAITQLPVCDLLALGRLGPDLGATELLTGSTP